MSFQNPQEEKLQKVPIETHATNFPIRVNLRTALQLSGLLRRLQIDSRNPVLHLMKLQTKHCDPLSCFFVLFKIRLHGHTILNNSSIPFKLCSVSLYRYFSQLITNLQVTYRWPPQRCPQNRSHPEPLRWLRSGTRPHQPWSPDESVGCCLPVPGTCLHSTGEEEDGQKSQTKKERKREQREETTKEQQCMVEREER